jgi:hypothetical protein
MIAGNPRDCLQFFIFRKKCTQIVYVNYNCITEEPIASFWTNDAIDIDNEYNE